MTTTTTPTRNNGVPKAERWVKGERVTMFGSWDNKGTFWFTHAVVYSCGGKQMVLTSDSSGKELGRHFDPNKVQPCIVPVLSDDEAREYAMTLAAAYLVRERAHFDRCLMMNAHLDSYCAAIRTSIAALHEPLAYHYAR